MPTLGDKQPCPDEQCDEQIEWRRVAYDSKRFHR